MSGLSGLDGASVVGSQLTCHHDTYDVPGSRSCQAGNIPCLALVLLRTLTSKTNQ